jgi:DNA-directed RNA polymerase II subunit RPB2
MNNLEKSVVTSRFGKYLHYSSLPVGMNAMVAIASYSGYNQEDSVILNGHSVDLGFFRTTYYHVYKDEEKKIQSNGKEEKFCKPDPEYTKGIKPGNYDKLDERGFVKINEFVTSKDVIIGKKLPIKNKYLNGHQVYKDCSTSLRPTESGYVDQVMIDRNEEGFLSGKVRIRNERIPSIGSKFASRVGQKGTVGMIYPQEQMPFTKDGLVPDIIMTPMAMPSRMTIGQMIEGIIGKAAVHLGGYAECTVFSEVDTHKLGAIMEANGFDYCGNEVLYSGITGKQMDVQIFFGPTYYQRLKHMAEDKVHSRNSGPVVQLTRQPAEGRSRDGGLRIGEMEKDCMNAHGAVAFLKERLLDVSDGFDVYVCGNCGNYAVVNPSEDVKLYRCDNCDNFNSFRRIAIPYAAKLLSQELQGMGLNMRYLFENNPPQVI